MRKDMAYPGYDRPGLEKEVRRAIFSEDLEERFYRDLLELCIQMCGKPGRNFLGDDLPNAVLVGLDEPLKVRVISKMDPYLMTLFKPLQTWMHRVLRNHDTFKLTGEPIDWEYVQGRLGQKLAENELYISSDYQNATGNLYSWCSEYVAECVAEKVYTQGGYLSLDKESFLKLFKKTLTQHNVVMDKTSRPQTRGQLMGSVTSFPILCIINAGVNRVVLEKARGGQRTGLRNLPMAINGDDIVIKGGQGVFADHATFTALTGLKLSQGKVFTSRKVINMNSRFFFRAGEREVIKPTGVLAEKKMVQVIQPVPYYSIGTIKGKSDFGQRYRDSVERGKGLVSEEFIHKEFIRYNKEAMTRWKLPWYIPEWLGGWGLTTPYTLGKVSVVDRQVVNKIFSGWKQKRPSNPYNQTKTWMMWDLAEEELTKRVGPSAVKVETIPDTVGGRRYDRAITSTIVNLLSDSNIKLTDIFRPPKKGKKGARQKDVMRQRILRKNEKMWNPKTYKSLQVTPVDPEKLIKRNRYLSLAETRDEEVVTHEILKFMTGMYDQQLEGALREAMVKGIRRSS